MLEIDILVNHLFTHQFPVVILKVMYSPIHEASTKGDMDIKYKYLYSKR